jgi:hypothetical protein
LSGRGPIGHQLRDQLERDLDQLTESQRGGSVPLLGDRCHARGVLGVGKGPPYGDAVNAAPRGDLATGEPLEGCPEDLLCQVARSVA